jgi:hypothetical protein
MDVRVPIGGLLSILGLLITGYGLATAGDGQVYAKSLAFNVNLWWGTFMLIFGLALLGLARRK